MPKCPYCEEELNFPPFDDLKRKDQKKDLNPENRVQVIDYETFFSESMYYCPFCDKILGFSSFNRH